MTVRDRVLLLRRERFKTNLRAVVEHVFNVYNVQARSSYNDVERDNYRVAPRLRFLFEGVPFAAAPARASESASTALAAPVVTDALIGAGSEAPAGHSRSAVAASVAVPVDADAEPDLERQPAHHGAAIDLLQPPPAACPPQAAGPAAAPSVQRNISHEEFIADHRWAVDHVVPSAEHALVNLWFPTPLKQYLYQLGDSTVRVAGYVRADRCMVQCCSCRVRDVVCTACRRLKWTPMGTLVFKTPSGKRFVASMKPDGVVFPGVDFLRDAAVPLMLVEYKSDRGRFTVDLCVLSSS